MKRSKNLDKTKAQRIHAKRRAEERYGLVLNSHQMKVLVFDIQKGRGTFLGAQSNRVSLWLLKVGEKSVRVVYDKVRKTIVSFLPLEEREAVP